MPHVCSIRFSNAYNQHNALLNKTEIYHLRSCVRIFLFPGPWGGGGGGVNFDGYYISGVSLSQSLVVFDFIPAQEIICLAFIPKIRMNNFQETLTQGSATAMAEATMTDQEELALPRFSQGLESDQPRYLDP